MPNKIKELCENLDSDIRILYEVEPHIHKMINPNKIVIYIGGKEIKTSEFIEMLYNLVYGEQTL